MTTNTDMKTKEEKEGYNTTSDNQWVFIGIAYGYDIGAFGESMHKYRIYKFVNPVLKEIREVEEYIGKV